MPFKRCGAPHNTWRRTRHTNSKGPFLLAVQALTRVWDPAGRPVPSHAEMGTQHLKSVTHLSAASPPIQVQYSLVVACRMHMQWHLTEGLGLLVGVSGASG